MLAIPKDTLKRSEMKGTKMIIEKYPVEVHGAQMVPDFPKLRCKEL